MSERRVALVAGAAGGIGRAVAEALERDGFRVGGIDRSSADVPAVERWYEADLRDAASCGRVVADAVAAFGRLDAFVHAAGVTRDSVAWKLAASDWDEVLRTNLDSAFHLARAAVPVMRSGGAGGALVFISSINGERGKFGLTAYAASKAGLHGLAKSLAREVGRFGIRVNCVAPGMILTGMTRALPEPVLRAAAEESCLGRLGEASDVADAVAFLVSPAARHVTGQVLRVDGGQYT